MDDELAKNAPRIQADNQSIAIGEINITGTVTGNITSSHTIVHRAACPCGCAPDMLDVESAGKVRSGGQEDSGEGEKKTK